MSDKFVYGYGYGGMFGSHTHTFGLPIPRAAVKSRKLVFECDFRDAGKKNRVVGRGWDLTSHKHESFAFAEEEFECDSCEEPILKGQLISVGYRMVEGDMEIECTQYKMTGIDRIHIGCKVCLQDEGKDHVHSIYCNMQLQPLSIKGVDVRALPGYAALTEEDKRQYMEKSGATSSASLDAILPLCHGVVAVITMDPSVATVAKSLVVQHGGTVEVNVTKDTTHLIYGPKMKIYSTVYGVDSPRYKAAKRRKLPMFTTNELKDLITKKERLLSDAVLEEMANERAALEAEREAAKAAKAKEREERKKLPKEAVAPSRRSTRKRGGTAEDEPKPKRARRK